MNQALRYIHNWGNAHLDEAEINLGTRKRIPVAFVEDEPTDGPVDYRVSVTFDKDAETAFREAMADRPF